MPCEAHLSMYSRLEKHRRFCGGTTQSRGVLRCIIVPRLWRCGSESTMPYVTTYNFTSQENIMKTLRQLFAVIVLTLTIAVPSSAGNMHTTAPTPPPDPTPATTQGEMTTSDGGDMHTGDTDE